MFSHLEFLGNGGFISITYFNVLFMFGDEVVKMSNDNYYNIAFQSLCITIIIYKVKSMAYSSLKRITNKM